MTSLAWIVFDTGLSRSFAADSREIDPPGAPRRKRFYVGIRRSYARYATPHNHSGGSASRPSHRAQNRRPRSFSVREVRRGTLLPLHLHDFIGFGAAGRHHLDLGALLLADKGAGERRGDGNLALLGVRLGFADD